MCALESRLSVLVYLSASPGCRRRARPADSCVDQCRGITQCQISHSVVDPACHDNIPLMRIPQVAVAPRLQAAGQKISRHLQFTSKLPVDIFRGLRRKARYPRPLTASAHLSAALSAICCCTHPSHDPSDALPLALPPHETLKLMARPAGLLVQHPALSRTN